MIIYVTFWDLKTEIKRCKNLFFIYLRENHNLNRRWFYRTINSSKYNKIMNLIGYFIQGDNNELYSINSMVQEEYEKKIDTLLDGLFYNDK